MELIYEKCFDDNFKDVELSEIQSLVDSAFGITQEDYNFLTRHNLSLQSLRICCGNRIEIVTNDIATIQGINLIEDERVPQGFYKRNGKTFKKGDPKPDKIIKHNKVKIGNKSRQVDHFFRNASPNYKIGRFYFDSKSCVYLDTEKDPASEEKLRKVAEALGADEYGYFIPFVETVPQHLVSLHPNIKLYGVRDMLEILGNPFTSEEWFFKLKQIKNKIFEYLRNKYETNN